MEKKAGKKYFHIDSNTGNGVFAILEEVGSEDEAYLSDVMNDSDTEFVADEPLDIVRNCDAKHTLVPEANVHVIPDAADAPKPPKRKLKDKIKKMI